MLEPREERRVICGAIKKKKKRKRGGKENEERGVVCERVDTGVKGKTKGEGVVDE